MTDNTAKRIRKALESTTNPFKASDIAQITGDHQRTVEKALKCLQSWGKVTIHRDGTYTYHNKAIH